jgi:WD40 repeat protein
MLAGHRNVTTGVAVGKDAKKPLVISASEDGTARVWERTEQQGQRRWQQLRVWLHNAPVRAVACTPAGSEGNLCLTGAADGLARLWDLDNVSEQPLHELKGEHKGPISAVAFSPDGKLCATGGEDRGIILWDTATGQVKHRLPRVHGGAITSLQFSPQDNLLISIGRDYPLRVWKIEADKVVPQKQIERRTVGVQQVVLSPDGKRVLVEQGKDLCIVSLPGGNYEGLLQNPPSSANQFKTLAEFSPDGQLALTAGATEGRLQLWRLPTATTRAYELRQLIPIERAEATCAAFSPDGSFIVTGNGERLYIWPVPSKEEIGRQFTAKLAGIDASIEGGPRHVKVWAEMDNPDGRLIPGDTATMVFYPRR